MKAYEVMTFLLIFNLAISVISVLSVYNMGIEVSQYNESYDVSGYQASTNNPGKMAFRILAIDLFALTAGMVAGALLGYVFLKIPADRGAMYGAFTGVFWGSFYNSMAVLAAVGGGHLGVMIIIYIFTVLSGVIFFVGLMQLVSGPWRGMK